MKLFNKILVDRAKKRIKEIAPNALHTALDSNAILIDVREPGEFDEGYIDGAVNMPRGVIEFQIRSHPQIAGAQTDPGAPIYLYCVSGARSAMAAQSLKEMGFEDVVSLAGGISAWREAGLPIVVSDETD